MSTTDTATKAPVKQAPKPEPWTAARIRAIPVHDLCKLISPHTEEEREELLVDIRKNKLIVPIKTYEGSILDGRGRREVCAELTELGDETNFRTETFDGTLEEARAYVISTNVKRRHLTQSQRAISAARMVTTKLGGDRKNQSATLPTEITQEGAARLFGVSIRLVTDAVLILSRPELVEPVEAGEKTVSIAADEIRNAASQTTGSQGNGEGSSARTSRKSGKSSKPTTSSKKVVTPPSTKQSDDADSLVDRLIDVLKEMKPEPQETLLIGMFKRFRDLGYIQQVPVMTIEMEEKAEEVA